MPVDPVQRRLAAILAADVAGYSMMMGEDEEGTLAALTQPESSKFVSRHENGGLKTAAS